MNADDFARAMRDLRIQLIQSVEMAMPVAGEVIAVEAKRILGKEDNDWEGLKPATIAKKVRLSLPVPSPLFREGEHIHDTIQVRAEGLSVSIGTNSDVAVAQEKGTSLIPARPFLSTAWTTKGEEAASVINQAIGIAISRITGE